MFYLVSIRTIREIPYSLVCPLYLARHQYCPLLSGVTGEMMNPTCEIFLLLRFDI